MVSAGGVWGGRWCGVGLEDYCHSLNPFDCVSVRLDMF